MSYIFFYLATNFDPSVVTVQQNDCKSAVPNWFFFYPDPIHVGRAVCRLCAEETNVFTTHTCAKDSKTINSHLRRHSLISCAERLEAAKKLGKNKR